jgi:hypothetical protein
MKNFIETKPSGLQKSLLPGSMITLPKQGGQEGKKKKKNTIIILEIKTRRRKERFKRM